MTAPRSLLAALALVGLTAPALGQPLPPRARVQADTDGDGRTDCIVVIPALGTAWARPRKPPRPPAMCWR